MKKERREGPTNHCRTVFSFLLSCNIALYYYFIEKIVINCQEIDCMNYIWGIFFLSLGTTCSSDINDTTKIPTTVLKKFEEEKHCCKNLSSMDEHTSLVSKIDGFRAGRIDASVFSNLGLTFS